MQSVLITGATGYVGGRLLKVLEGEAYPVRCLARHPEFLRPRVAPETEIMKGDLLDRSTLFDALGRVDTAYYLVHSMGSKKGFAEEDRRAAQNFSAVARETGLKRIVYLGGLGSDTELSPHLASRQEVGQILRDSGVPTIEFRCSIIIGSGSLSFEMIRSLVNRLPLMATPRWTRSRAQPIAIDDVLAYLVAAMELQPFKESAIFEIGGPNPVSYLELMKVYARVEGLRRLIIPVPVLTPRLSSLWLGLVTPLYARVGRKLIDSVRNETLARDACARETFSVRPLGVEAAVRRAIRNEDQELAQTRWSDALSSQGPKTAWAGVQYGSRIVDSRTIEVPVSISRVFKEIQRIGGSRGWHYANWAWSVRGWMDLLMGGAGMRRGRPHPERLLPGNTLDCWRVEAVEKNRLLRLVSEMKMPGRAWLQFETEEVDSRCILRQTAIFDPRGLAGLLYWYALYPAHQFIFRGMLKKIVQAASSRNLK